MNVVLIGFMGTGKSVVTHLLAEIFSLRYLSTDELIEKSENRSIREIFEKEGESYFRKVEKRVVREVSSLKGVVVDAGGGVVLDKENMANLKECGKVIGLSASPEVILKRTQKYQHRPLLNVLEPEKKIAELLKIRAPLYQSADITIDTSNLTVDETVEKIVQYLTLEEK